MSALNEVRTIFILEPEASYEEVNDRLVKMGYNPMSSQRLRSARCDTKDTMGIIYDNAETLGVTFQPGVSDRLRRTTLMRGPTKGETYEQITKRFHEGVAAAAAAKQQEESEDE